MAKVLAFDCAGSGCAAAVVLDGRVAARRSQPMARGQAEALLPMLAAVLAEAGSALAALDLIAVTTGPGSFTGLRIGLAAARGLALASGLPILGVTSFAAVAAAVPPERRAGRSLVVALDSKREALFLQSFAPHGPPLAEAAPVAPEAASRWVPAGPLLLAGDGAARLLPHLAQAEWVPGTEAPDPADLARLAVAAWQPGSRPPPPDPFYLRAPDTSLPRRADRVRR